VSTGIAGPARVAGRLTAGGKGGAHPKEGTLSGRVYLLGVGIALVALAFVGTDALLWEPGMPPVPRRGRCAL
jgi:hypothetical protein